MHMGIAMLVGPGRLLLLGLERSGYIVWEGIAIRSRMGKLLGLEWSSYSVYFILPPLVFFLVGGTLVDSGVSYLVDGLFTPSWVSRSSKLVV